jgi:hypothetical protein
MDDEWDSGDDGYDNTLIGLTTDNIGEHIPLCFDLVKGEDYFLVWVEYTTGDSFGSTIGNTEVIDLFKTESLAKDCVKVIESNTGYTFSFVRENGKNVTKAHRG